jgi:flagellar biosynthetic protein FlhB
MAEEQDQSQKTEEPTQKRLEEARGKGQVATSREVNNAMMLGAAALFVALLAPTVAGDVARVLRPFIAAPHSFAAAPADLRQTLLLLIGELGALMLLPALLFLAAALASGLVQNGLVFSAEPLAPKLSKISLVAGTKRLFSAKSLVEFVKGVLKISLVGAAGVALLWPMAPAVIQSAGLGTGPLLVLLRDLTLRLLAGVAALTALIALFDVLYQRFEHRKQLRMSRRDLQDEFKQTEGDPAVKARLKGLRMERARRRMMAAVPDATVVITNPTHYAVALSYTADTMAAPRLVAKGVDALAERICTLARTHRVPIVQNPPLARALHAQVEIGGEIPPAHYRAAAEVIGYVLRLKRRS